MPSLEIMSDTKHSVDVRKYGVDTAKAQMQIKNMFRLKRRDYALFERDNRLSEVRPRRPGV